MITLGLDDHIDAVRLAGRRVMDALKTGRRRHVASGDPSILEQIRIAWDSPGIFWVGMVFGGFVPATTYRVSHHEASVNWAGWANWASFQANWAHWAIIGGLIFSATTVFGAGRQAFNNWAKALGFVILTEAVMIFSDDLLLNGSALALLALTNAIMTGTNLALQDQRDEDDDR